MEIAGIAEEMAQDLLFQRGDLGRAAAARPWQVDLEFEFYDAILDQHDPVTEDDRFSDVVGDEHGRELLLCQMRSTSVLHLDACERIERAKRLVQRQNLRVLPRRARVRHAGAGRRTARTAIRRRGPRGRLRQESGARAFACLGSPWRADKSDCDIVQTRAHGSRLGSWNMMRDMRGVGSDRHAWSSVS
jgi:hypothetical protein